MHPSLFRTPFPKPKINNTITYMEIYGTNRVLYRVTAANLSLASGSYPIYGVLLEDLCSGVCAAIADYSFELDNTIDFANDLVRRKIPPEQLYNEALRKLGSALVCTG